jgi:PIN domain
MDGNTRMYIYSVSKRNLVDGLKKSTRINNGKSIGPLARKAIRWAEDALRSEGSSVTGQKKDEMTNAEVDGDDAILECCLYSLTFLNTYPN